MNTICKDVKPIFDIQKQFSLVVFFLSSYKLQIYSEEGVIYLQNSFNTYCEENIKIYYDLDEKLLIFLIMNQKQIEILSLNGQKKNSFFIDNNFNENFVYFDIEYNYIIILDQQLQLIKYNYVQNKIQNERLNYQSLLGFLVDINKDTIFFYDKYQIYSHRFQNLQFLESIIDEVYYKFQITNIKIDKELNILIVYKENKQIILYDVHEIIYTEDYIQKENFEINYLQFQNFHFITYNIQKRYITLFQKSILKDFYLLTEKQIKIFNVAQLIKIGEDEFFYRNQEVIVYAQVDTQRSKIIIICEEFVSIEVQDSFYDKKSQKILIIEKQTFNIYELNLSKQSNICQIHNLFNNNEDNIFFNGVIQQRNLIFHSDDKLYIYSLDPNPQNLKQFKFGLIFDSEDKLFIYNLDSNPQNLKQFKFGKVRLIEKLNSQNSQNIRKREEGYQNERSSNEYDGIQDQLILIILQDDHQILTFDTLKLVIIQKVNIEYIILNIKVDFDSNTIFIVGNQGYSYSYSYELKQKQKLTNPCLHQTKILYDDYYIYLICPKQLNIYSKALDKIYSSIKTGLQNLHKIIYTKQKDIFIFIQYKNIQVVSIKQNNFRYNVLFEMKKELLSVVNWQVFIDQNYLKSIEIVAVSTIDVVNFKIQLQKKEQNGCQVTFQQSDENTLKQFLFKNLQENIIKTSQNLRQLRILNQQNTQLYIPSLLDNPNNKDGLRINYFSERSFKTIINYESRQIFDNPKIKYVELNSMNLSIEGDKEIVWNSNQKITLENIKFINIQQPIKFQNFQSIILSNIIFENITNNNLNNIFSFEYCYNITILNLTIKNSQFNQSQIIKIENSNQIIVKDIYIFNSSIHSLILINKTNELSLKGVSVHYLSLQNSLIEQNLVENTDISNLTITNLSGQNIIKQKGCQYIKIKDFELNYTKNTKIIEVLPINDKIIYKNLNHTISNLNVSGCFGIQLNIHSDNLQIQYSNFNEIKQNTYNLMNFYVDQLNMTQVKFNKIQTVKDQTDQDLAILKIKNYNSINIQNSIFYSNNMSLIRISNQNDISQDFQIIKFNNTNITENTCLEKSLIEITDSYQLQILNSYFDNNSADYNGGVFLIQNMTLLILNNSHFKNNTSNNFNGGCLYLEKVSMTYIKLSTFTLNKIQGKGGAIFMSNVNLKMNDSEIKNNSAAIGGGIFYEVLIPDIIAEKDKGFLKQISDNQCIFYGHNIGSSLRQFYIEPQNQQDFNYSFNFNNITQQIFVENFQSGSYLLLKNIQFQDEERNALNFIKNITKYTQNQQIIKEFESLSITIQPSDENNQNSQAQLVFQGGLVQKYSEKGFNFNVSLSYYPEKQIKFLINSNTISQLNYANGTLYSKDNQIKLNVFVDFRICQLGEIKQTVNQNIICYKCPQGKYSLDQDDLICKPCPLSAIDCQGSDIKLKQGYWRKSIYTDVITQCTANQLSCQASNDQSQVYQTFYSQTINNIFY